MVYVKVGITIPGDVGDIQQLQLRGARAMDRGGWLELIASPIQANTDSITGRCKRKDFTDQIEPTISIPTCCRAAALPRQGLLRNGCGDQAALAIAGRHGS